MVTWSSHGVFWPFCCCCPSRKTSLRAHRPSQSLWGTQPWPGNSTQGALGMQRQTGQEYQAVGTREKLVLAPVRDKSQAGHPGGSPRTGQTGRKICDSQVYIPRSVLCEKGGGGGGKGKSSRNSFLKAKLNIFARVAGKEGRAESLHPPTPAILLSLSRASHAVFPQWGLCGPHLA